jgi:flagellar biosynthesis anti-sigma factor FlgM
MEVSGKGVFEQIPNLVERETGSTTGGNARGAAAASVRSVDKVVLSPQAREIDDAKIKLMNMPDIRKDMVSDIRHRINSGTYVLKGDKIAFHMLKESVLNQRISA